MFNAFSENQIKEFKSQFQNSNSEPFSHVVIPNLLDKNFASDCSSQFTNAEKNQISNFVRYSDTDFEFEKYALNSLSQMPSQLAKLFSELHSPNFIKFIESVTGFEGLKVDEGRWGGGLHMTKKGGYLACHKDFSVLPSSYKNNDQMLRTINIIGYLNPNWKPGWGGELELWDSEGTHCEKKIEPSFNQWVVFDTRGNYHGHPYPYQGDSPRYSIAAYYYLEQPVEKERWTSTAYLKLPWKDESPEYQKKRQDRANAELRYKGMI